MGLLNDSVMNKNYREQTQFSPKKIDSRKKNGFAIIYIFAIYYHTYKKNKQTIYSFNDIQASSLHIIQYHNIYKTVIIKMTII